MQQVSFSRDSNNLFFKTLNQRVNKYFKENNIKRTGNWVLYSKAALMLSLLFVPYLALLFFPMHNAFRLLMCVLMGLGMAGVGMNVMHDSNHGSFSSKWWVNQLLGNSIYLLAGNVYNWKVQHNLLHHTYTNVEGVDEDIDIQGIIRLSKHERWKPMHKYQKIYAFLLYGLLTIQWALVVDFRQTPRYIKKGLSAEGELNPRKEWALLIMTKIVYYLFWLALPMLVLPIAWYQWLIGFFVMHYIAGLILSVVFQLAHITDVVEVISPEDLEKEKRSWAAHQLLETANFATKNKFISFFLGGLNFQIEHHIFPTISHVHYKDLAKIVKKTASEFQLPYYEYETIALAFKAHLNQLIILGKQPQLG
ncbi:acyl-CoA desaturase [Wenyingzhuangia sp. 2_MG-2023]|uniref:fatty acid desaturase family protein n=1 Tax=Wenyingzhuangia sp. 2_MG-2023 TaxID=3062639 RepID=UPI0026E2EE17|nr:acyl-CoA desaturase [Wenyingzhuangia sp. 2_MG-2023]MDO6737600.1 acyl-CoA desaturase [Wenyingzhuangia sp. 2_MG-2023]MDO6802438.1 acyl-CoA desaturase [Wenyingzhuangia sp. 1_MG-2023]